VLSLSELVQCKYRGYATDEGLETFSVADIILEECSNNDCLCACGSCRPCSPVSTTTPDAIVIDDIEEFDDKDDSEDGIKEFGYDDAMKDNQLSLPSIVGQQKPSFSCKKSVTTYPQKHYCDIIV